MKPGRPFHPWKEDIARCTQDLSLAQGLHMSLNDVKALSDDERWMYLSLLSGMGEGRKQLDK